MDRGVEFRLSEAHIVLKCPCVSAQGRSFIISKFSMGELRRGVDSLELVRRTYIGVEIGGGGGASKNVLLERGRRLIVLIEAWQVTCHENSFVWQD